MFGRPTIYDATTLRNFGTIGRLDLCQIFSENTALPRWTSEVCEEITRAAEELDEACGRVYLATWLGEPVCPTDHDLIGIIDLQIELGDGPNRNAGEAESMYFAEKLGYVFATDDNAAYRFAASRPALGLERVIDTVDILTAVVRGNVLSCEDAAALCSDMRAAGRSLRRRHPWPLEPRYFQTG